MYRSLLVPLDRSSFAEQALPLALSIARRAKARLDLAEVHALYALEHPTAGWVPFEPERDAERKRQEQLYLDATARQVSSEALPVSGGGSTFPQRPCMRAKASWNRSAAAADARDQRQHE
jgi:hypothetical protein